MDWSLSFPFGELPSLSLKLSAYAKMQVLLFMLFIKHTKVYYLSTKTLKVTHCKLGPFNKRIALILWEAGYGTGY
jgi:uncharacterized membrane protein